MRKKYSCQSVVTGDCSIELGIVIELLLKGSEGLELLALVLGETIPPEISTLKASSMEIERLITSSSGITAYHPEVGLGVVGIKTLNIFF